MKFGFALFSTIVLGSGTDAFTASVGRSSRVTHSSLQEKIADELDIPCEDECALDSYPDMPPSVHPGVVTGQAMLDLLDHAKENGESNIYNKTCHLLFRLNARKRSGDCGIKYKLLYHTIAIFKYHCMMIFCRCTH